MADSSRRPNCQNYISLCCATFAVFFLLQLHILLLFFVLSKLAQTIMYLTCILEVATPNLS
jgi:hypothetical protein